MVNDVQLYMYGASTGQFLADLTKLRYNVRSCYGLRPVHNHDKYGKAQGYDYVIYHMNVSITSKKSAHFGKAAMGRGPLFGSSTINGGELNVSKGLSESLRVSAASMPLLCRCWFLPQVR
eukprot:scpid97860/ scgid27724/ 